MSQAVRQIIETQTGIGAGLCSHMPDPLERMLKSNMQTIRLGQYLLAEAQAANSVFVLLNGWLSLSKSLPDGEIQIVDFALPGEIIETCAAEGAVSAVSIEALTDVRVAIIALPLWEEMKRHRPDLTRISRAVRAAASARTAERMLRLGRGNAMRRMAYALLELNIRLEATGQAREGKFHLPMNQRVLGDFVGLSSVHVCRTLGQMVGNGTLRMGANMHVEILKRDLMAEIAGVDLKILQSGIRAESSLMASAPPTLA